jgi:hydrogenase-1 operon protein HyaF
MTVRLADMRGTLAHGYGLGAGLDAVLAEVVQRLEQLAAGESPEAIDLRSLPLNPADREHLAGMLGDGEVDITMRLDGASRVRETGATGVWWVEHRDARGELIAELLEITRIPEILDANPGDIGRSARALRGRIAAARRAATSEDTP